MLLFLWMHRAWGYNRAMPVVIKECQALVSRGPYQWVRHPMSTTIFVRTLAFLLMSASWFVGIAWLGLGIVATAIVGAEEMALTDVFGETYRGYMRRTGRFLPRVRQR